ncbi:MAG TPA: acetyl-CoA carboxylase [Fimbriimonadales bacterium]|nr:acetyl-CoA carboxylase [Fimbriimonadales bacterium]
MTNPKEKLEELASLLSELGLESLAWQEEGLFIEVKRASRSNNPIANVAEGTSPTLKEEGTIVPSPMTGIFYRRPSPSEPPFVEEGERIAVGQVVGIIEAMKVFNEVESPVSGILKKFLVEDGGLIQEGSGLYVVIS